MNFRFRFFIVYGSLLVLTTVGVILVRMWWLRSLTANLFKLPYLLRQLESQRQSDPRVIMSLIKVHERIVARIQPDKDPVSYALAQTSLGDAYNQLQIDRAVNLARAITCYQEALRFQTPESTPLYYALTQAGLGRAYYNLPIGDRTTNLVQAITSCQEALRFLTPETELIEYVSTLASLGNAYAQLPIGNHAENLEQAIVCYQEVLRFRTPEIDPFNYAGTQNNMGFTYSQLPRGNRLENLQQAMACYEEALRFWTPESTPLEYAGLKNNIGYVYGELLTGDRLENLKQAIVCYQEALRFQLPEVVPFEYGRTQANLGLAYNYLSQLTGDRAATLFQAMTCYQEALRFRTPEAAPLDYASTQVRLGNVYRKLLTGNRRENLEQAIICYEEALNYLTPETSPFEYAATLTNFGSTYIGRLAGNRAENLERAMTCYQEALRFLTPEEAPREYAGLQSNLGIVYNRLSTGNRAENLEQAITCYQEALRYLTPEVTPFEYASVQNNLGKAYSKRLTGDRDTDLVQAIACYEEALRYWTPEIAPADCRSTNQDLADLYFAQRQWNAALRFYRDAMDAGERLYRAGLSTESKAVEVAENVMLYRNAAFTATRLGETTEALIILERGKTRLLADSLRLRVPRPADIPDDVWSEFEQASAAVRAAQSERAALFGEEGDPLRSYANREQVARAATAALDEAIERIRIYAPDFLRAIDWPKVQRLLPDERTVLITFCITDQGSIGLVVRRNHGEEVLTVDIPNFTQIELGRLLIQRDTNGIPINGWLVDYYRFLLERTQVAFTTWQETITNTLAALGQQLLAPLLFALPPHIQRIIFLPSAELFLLPLHAASLSDGGAYLVCDRYQVSYAPSIEVLANVQAKAMQAVVPNLYAIINPQADAELIFTTAEGTAIARLFAQHEVNQGQQDGTKQRVVERVRGRTYVHFSCHGEYNWNDPTASGLTLADSRLTLADLQRGVADLSAARLVTLSACETGIPDVFQGSAEEYVGIPAGFMLAGVPCVVSSLWAVPDLSTALLMEQFYRNHLSYGMDFAAALREAQLWVRKLRIGEVAEYAERCYRQSNQKDERALYENMLHYRYLTGQNPTLRPFAHPYYWAAFTVNGI